MFRRLIVLLLISLANLSFGQIVLTQTHNDAIIGLDRKAWAGLGNTSPLSDGYAHDFTLPAMTNPCEEITGINININLTGYSNSNNSTCPHFETFYNIFYGCTTYSGGATCLPATNLIAEPNFSVNTNPPEFNFGSPLGSPLNSGIIPQFGDNLSIDIIPVSNPGCNAVSNGYISHEYTITVTITITDTTPPPPTVECWETAVFNNSTCLWDVTGTQPPAPAVECWETATFNNTTCSWEVSGTQPSSPTIECWETATFNNTTCLWEVSGTQPPEPNGLECWETTTFNNATCSWEVSGTQPSPPSIECWETATFNNTTCLWEVSGDQPTPPTTQCWETATFNNSTCSWEVSGTQPSSPTIECWETTTFNNATCSWEVSGDQPTPPTTQCWETAMFNNTTCLWEVSGTQPLQPMTLCNEEAIFNSTLCLWEINQVSTEPILQTLFFCENEEIQLSADIDNATYIWNTGDTSRDIMVSEAGIYSVEITDNQGCIFQKEITLNNYDLPEIESVVSNGTSIIVNTVNPGNYEYSIDGIGYQLSNVFNGVEGDYYTIYVRSVHGCLPNQFQHLHFVIPKVMTPNGDSYNDTFNLKGIEFYESSEVYIFDRYGKLLKSTKNSPLNWDGTFNNQILPSDDYWYLVKIEGQEFRGHFTLKR